MSHEHGFNCPCDDGVCCLFDITEGGDLWEEVLEVASDAGVLMSRDESDVGVVVEVGVCGGKVGDDRTTDASVAHGDV